MSLHRSSTMNRECERVRALSRISGRNNNRASDRSLNLAIEAQKHKLDDLHLAMDFLFLAYLHHAAAGHRETMDEIAEQIVGSCKDYNPRDRGFRENLQVSQDSPLWPHAQFFYTENNQNHLREHIEYFRKFQEKGSIDRKYGNKS